MRNHPRAWLGLGIALIVLAMPFMLTLAVHGQGLFELGDGTESPGSADILGSSDQAGPDWADIFDPDGNVRSNPGIDEIFVVDSLAAGGATDSTTFTSSNKNTDPPSIWQWGSGNIPAKDDLSNVYGLAAIDAANEMYLYFGLERIDPGGDSHLTLRSIKFR
jgi:hypothetical protein